MRKTGLLLTTMALIMLLASGVALAAFPGSNGAIVFSKDDESGKEQVYRMAPSGAGLTKLTDTPGKNEQPVWSSDGKKIVFTNTQTKSDIRPDMYLMTADGSNERRLTHNKWIKDQSPSWFPDRNKIVFASDRTGRWDLYTLEFDAAGNQLELTRLTHGWGTDLNPVVSPDGKKIAFRAWGKGRTREQNMDIFVMKANVSEGPTNRPINLTDTPNSSEVPSDWSPNGKKIAFHDWDSLGIGVMNADGTHRTEFNRTEATKRGVFPAWSPDGRKIVFMSIERRTYRHTLWRMNTDGSNKTELPTEGDYPDWQPLP
jgi:TolB protein